VITLNLKYDKDLLQPGILGFGSSLPKKWLRVASKSVSVTGYLPDAG